MRPCDCAWSRTDDPARAPHRLPEGEPWLHHDGYSAGLGAVSFHPTPIERLPGMRIDPELGAVRACANCAEEWPWDEEFYLPVKVRTDGVAVLRNICRACWLDGWLRRIGDPRATA